MLTSDFEPVVIQTTKAERLEIYNALDIKGKLASGQAYMRTAWTGTRQPRGNFPRGTRSRTVEIFLSVNDYFICMAHRYVGRHGIAITEPDPKYIHIDDVVFSQ